VIKRNYILQEPSEMVQQSKQYNTITIAEDNFSLKKNVLSKKQFEKYIKKEKPYLEPNLKITDLGEKLGINRTYISAFINTEYGTNFSTYINHLRLIEYEQLRTNTMFKHKSNSELSEKAGFGSYRSCTRFAAIERQDK
jgi:YesN/AraC family two-component response regulator